MNHLLDMPMLNAASACNVKRLHDTVNECIYIINTTIGKERNENNEIFAYLILRKFDKEGLQLYEQHVKKPNQIQKLEDVMELMEQLFQTLESQQQTKNRNNELRNQSTNYQSDRRDRNCEFCKQSNHRIYYCERFLETTISNRLAYVQNKQICKICLNHNSATKCFSTIRCRKCNNLHHTLLHNDNYQTGKKVEGNQQKNGVLQKTKTKKINPYLTVW